MSRPSHRDTRSSVRTGLGALAATLALLAGGHAQADDLKPPFDLKDPKIIDAGRLQFAQTCVYCHGNEASGGRAGPLRGRTDLTTDYVFTTISNGKRVGAMVMPTWKDSIDEETRWKLTAYIMSLQATPAGGGAP